MQRLRDLILLATLWFASTAEAAQLRIVGMVTDKFTAAPLAEAQVRVYRNGERVRTLTTGQNGRYELLLDNNADYVIRFVMPGHVTKCFTVTTHGPIWEGDHSIKEVFIEMTLFEQVPDMDLSFFDLPMGIARFDPLDGRMDWDEAYDGRIRGEVATLMDAVTRALAARGALAKLN
ncbi:MAG: carboxypeptidase regulatory-like domain-containing protein [Flavobacteriales bacterium]|nr:carboxypeptidase regulatory-like domain-containing protein [Flavobacteriales bacterium]